MITTYTHETQGRIRKAVGIASVLIDECRGLGGWIPELRRVDQETRDLVATAANRRSPSDATWQMARNMTEKYFARVDGLAEDVFVSIAKAQGRRR